MIRFQCDYAEGAHPDILKKGRKKHDDKKDAVG